MATATTTGAKKTRRKSRRTKRPAGSAERTPASKPEVDRAAASSPETAASTQDDTKTYDVRISAHRRRMASVAAFLNETFGRFGESNPDLWDRRAYLMIVGVVYERLAANESELSTDELVALSKVLAESRRAEAQSRKAQATENGASGKASPSDELPENFAETVRQVYGTNFQMPERAKGD